jgi:hypothetical protein
VTIGKTARVKGKGKKAYALVSVSCPATETGGCAGKLTLATAAAVRVGKLKAVVQLGSARFSLKPGETKKLKVRLASGYAHLAKRHKLAARATALSRDQAGNAADSTSKVTLTLPA